jgi:gluconolactonase
VPICSKRPGLIENASKNMNLMKIIFIILLFITTYGMSQTPFKIIGIVERYDTALDKIVSKEAKAEIIAEGFDWSEGALWIEKHKMLLSSDVPTNTIYKWTEAKGKEVYLQPSGYTGIMERGGEMGSNGLTLDEEGRLVICQHGDRRMARMKAPLDKPESKFVTLADKYQDKRFSSPNDATYNRKGELFFTDPPYGLLKQSDDDPDKEIPWNGVYKVKKNGEVILLTDSLTRPNGIAFFPGEQKLLIANSDPQKSNWYVFDINGDKLNNGKIFYHAVSTKGMKGLPDGLKIDKQGNVFATGPGGIHIFNKDGKLLGKLKLDEASSNCSLSADQKTLYITNDMYLLRFKMRN